MRQFDTPTTVGGYEIKPDELTITRLSDQRVIRLSKSECLIVRMLAEEPNVTISRERLLEVCWAGKVVTHSSLTVAIKHIRTAFAEIGENNIIVTEPKKGYLLRISDDTTSSGLEQLASQPTQSIVSDVDTKKSNLQQVQSKLAFFTRRYGIQAVFFIITLLVLSKYALFVETTTINGIQVYYDGTPIPQSVKESIAEVNQESIEVVTYPLGGLCPFYQVISVTEDAVFDLTQFIEQSDCDDE